MMKPGKKFLPIEKRAGVRRAFKRRPKKPGVKSTPQDYYKDRKGTGGVFPKRLGQYRFLICTDLETDDEVALAMFTAWVKTNEHFFDSRNSFPIYGFVVGETHNKRIKAQRAREFLKRFGDILAWDDKEHHLYRGYSAAGNRIWFDGESDKPFENEKELVVHQEALEAEDYPDPESYITAINELMEVKASNLFILYLKPLRFFQSLKDRPEVFEYLRRVPGAMYGAWNVQCVLHESPELEKPILQFLNRTERDAPLLYTETFLAMGEDHTLNAETSPKLFRELDDAEDEELAAVINKTMYCWNDNLLNRQLTRLQDQAEFKETDFDDYQSFVNDCEKLSPERASALKPIIKVVDSIIKHNSRQFVCADPLVMVAILIATGTLTNTPFRLQRSTISYDGRFMSVEENSESNTRVLVPVSGINKNHVQKVKNLVERMLLAAFTITTE
uniref:Uncharacterized protein n=1 Tax=Marseillevirus LCMAC202 TaxID=2506606 RepID=A0A481YZX8_9VIRU|nr:MAG: hypothetical protein LCMAC202_04360 [Marseillevirus LCMAC202]